MVCRGANEVYGYEFDVGFGDVTTRRAVESQPVLVTVWVLLSEVRCRN